jgi:hypothetical protein
MARTQSDREDLLREATALVERAELVVAGWDESVVVGFRRDGCASVFFGAERVYQFNTAGQLRRAYVDGLLYKAEQGRLVALRRERGAEVVSLVRSEPTADETAEIISAMQSHLARFRDAIRQRTFTIAGQIPSDSDVVRRTSDWLAALPVKMAIAQVPNAG